MQLKIGDTVLSTGDARRSDGKPFGFTAHRSFKDGVPGPVFEVELA